MLKNEIYEEYFLNSSSAMYSSNIGGFVMKYGGLDISSNCVYPLYEKDDNRIEQKIDMIEDFLLEKEIPVLFRIVQQENYEYLDHILFSNTYEKVEPSVVLGCKIEGKKDHLFKYADFNEIGIFIEEFEAVDDEFLSDYSYFKEFSEEEEYIFALNIDSIPLKKYSLALQEENRLVGLAYFTRQDDVIVIKDIVISPKYRNLGYSTKILYSILTFCAKKDVSLVLAEVFLSNEEGVSLFLNNPMFKKIYDIFYRNFTKKRRK